ncbi:MAG: type I restriction endonuclease subunit R [Bacteroidales bacterium]|nr:type I restriction endonuclease subunit R [Bacteroidales bacterium]
MHNKLIESDVENAAIDWLKEQGYRYVHGSEIERPLNKVVLEKDLMHFIAKSYPHLPEVNRREVLQQFIHNEGIDLEHRNRDFHQKLAKGIDYVWKDKNGQEQQEHLYVVDFTNPENNNFLCVNQFPVKGKNNRRPDMIVFVNGLPLVVFEFKNWFDPEATVETAFNQIQHYKEDIPQLFEYNEITVISDGSTSLHGMYSSAREWFTPWKSVDGQQTTEDRFALDCLLKGLFPKERLLFYIRHFIFHEDHNGTLVKKGAKYHQFFGISFAVESTKKAIRPFGDGRIGVIWHTQGSGKSISMAFYSGILRKMPELKNPTLVIQVDRNDLDNQLHDNFVLAEDIVGSIHHVKTTDDLRRLLSGEGGGIIFSTIEKFRLKRPVFGRGEEFESEHPELSDRENIIVIADEAQRTQYGLLDGLAANLRKALPNASFIGFTGTPVDLKDADTQEVFGETIHTYDIKQAVDDGATVKLVYEPRLAKLHLGNEDINEEAEEITGSIETKDANKMKWAAVEDAAGSDDRVQKVARDILEHYTKRSQALEGKAMIVCMSRRNCVKMYNALSAMEGCPESAVIMTGNISKDPPEWNPHLRTKSQQEAIKSRFKDPEDPLRFVIVRDMWLTGFDAPVAHTMYVDKIMQGHNLMQAIARVNRVFGDKPSGLIVDYIGIGNKLRDATKKYTKSGGTGKPSYDIDEVFEQCKEQVEVTKSHLPDGMDYSEWKIISQGDKFNLVNDAVNHIVKDDKRADDFMNAEKTMSGLVSIVRSHQRIHEIALDVVFLQHVGAAVRKAKQPPVDKKKAEKKIKELIGRSIDSEEIIDVYAMAGIEKPDISILDEEFLAGAKEKKSGNEIKVELLRQILNNEIKVKMTKNFKKYTSLKKEVEEVIKKYHNNAIDSYTTIMELYQRAKEMQEEDRRSKELGLSEEELAFYDILANHKDAIKDYKLIKELVHKIVKAVEKNLQLDWYKKPDAQAAIRSAVKGVLRKNVELKELNAILAEIMEQAKGQYEEWPMVG